MDTGAATLLFLHSAQLFKRTRQLQPPYSHSRKDCQSNTDGSSFREGSRIRLAYDRSRITTIPGILRTIVPGISVHFAGSVTP